MDLNHRPLELEETAIPTEPQPLPLLVTLFDAAATLERNKFVFSFFFTRSATRLGNFLRFFVTNLPLKVAQMCGKTWAISKNITLK